MTSPSAMPVIERGQAHMLHAYEVGQVIDLDEAQRRIASLTERATIKHKRRAPKYFKYEPRPLRVIQGSETLAIAGHDTTGQVELVLFDFGAVSVSYTIPLTGPLATLVDLSVELYDDEILLADSRRRVADLLTLVGSAVTRPGIADLVESYAIFTVQEVAGPTAPGEILAAHAPLVARILRAEREDLSAQEVRDATACSIAFGLGDLTLIDGDAAIVFERNAEDVVAVLEFANVELLEMHYLDQKLDTVLNEAYRALSRYDWRKIFRPRTAREDLDRIARLQVDSALLFEGVNNVLKLVGDQFLARVYRLASERFHLADWDATILRKLQTTQDIYSKVSDMSANRRMEVLEWIIIALIAFEVVLSFVRQ